MSKRTFQVTILAVGGVATGLSVSLLTNACGGYELVAPGSTSRADASQDASPAEGVDAPSPLLFPDLDATAPVPNPDTDNSCWRNHIVTLPEGGVPADAGALCSVTSTEITSHDAARGV
jgi:hypothetical protein